MLQVIDWSNLGEFIVLNYQTSQTLPTKVVCHAITHVAMKFSHWSQCKSVMELIHYYGYHGVYFIFSNKFGALFLAESVIFIIKIQAHSFFAKETWFTFLCTVRM